MPNYKTVYVDCDETLVMSNLSEYSPEDQIVIDYVNGGVAVVPNEKNLNLLKYFFKLGYQVNVWSRTGGDWAEAVVKSLGIKDLVTHCLTKPMFYIDDQDVSVWMPPNTRRWRNTDE